ncbi:hypothetical protein AYI70_g11291, partial [Smittium culicis]
MLMYQNKKNKV